MILALTVWQPWASLIVGSPPTDGCPGAPPQKPVENRGVMVASRARKLLGRQIAIHAGVERRRNADAYHDIFKAKVFGPVVAPYRNVASFPLGAVVGVATLDRVIGPIDGSLFYERRFDGIPAETIASWGLDADGLRWFVSGYGLVFRDQRCIDPVPCKGAQWLWPLPDDIERAVTEQIARAA